MDEQCGPWASCLIFLCLFGQTDAISCKKKILYSTGSNNERKEPPESPAEDTNKPAQQPCVSKPTDTKEETLSLPTPRSHTETPGTASALVSRETSGVPRARVSKEVPVPAPSSVDYHSPEGFLQSLNIQIQDPVLMSALSGIFNGNVQVTAFMHSV